MVVSSDKTTTTIRTVSEGSDEGETRTVTRTRTDERHGLDRHRHGQYGRKHEQ